MIQSIQPLGDTAILLTFGTTIDLDVNEEIVSYVSALKKENIDGVLELISAYVTVTVQYDFLKVSYEDLSIRLKELDFKKVTNNQSKLIEIPVCYDGEFSFDMNEVEANTGLTKEEIVKIHTAKEYRVYMLGFTPGFFYLGGMDTRLFCPRKEKPRVKIDKGSVGIAGMQTGVYSVNSPGGWQIIGKTPLSIFSKDSTKSYFMVNQGDTIRFKEISLQEFKDLSK